VTLREWFKIDKRKASYLDGPFSCKWCGKPMVIEGGALIHEEEQVKEIEARLPDQPVGIGYLEARSQTWSFINAWAREALKKAREKNDSMNRDIVQTSMLRGEIKILKELINLPNPKTVKGLLEEE
jgi:hypothetical protein